jgi:TP901 family phage tail tape measure protein
MATNIVVRFVGETSSLQRAFSQATADSAKFKAQAGSLSAGLAGAGSSAMGLGRSLTMATIPIAILGGMAVKSAIDFEDSINKMTRLAGVSAEQAKRWSGDIKKMSKDVGRGPQELADALYFVASSGVPVAEAMDVVKAAAKAAAIGMGETEKVADALTSVTNTYGSANITAAEAADVLVAAVREGKGEADQYTRVIGRLTPVANSLGVEFNQVGAAMAVATNRGLSVAESATGIRQAMMAFVKPGKLSKDTIEELGGSWDEARKILKEKGLLEGMRYLKNLAGDNKEAFSRLQPNVRGLNAALILTSEEGAAQANAIFKDLEDNTGDLDESFKKASKTAKFKLEKALAGLKTIGIELGEKMLPILGKIAEKVAHFAENFSNLSDDTKGWIAKIAVGVVLLGPAIMIVALLLKGLAFLTSPIGLIAIGLIAAGLAIWWLWNNWQPFQDFIVDKVIPAFKDLKDYLSVKLPQGVDNLKAVWNDPKAFDNDDSLPGRMLRGIGRVRTALDRVKEDFPKGVEQLQKSWNDPAAMNEKEGWAAGFLRGIGLFHRGWDRIVRDFPKGIAKIKSFWTDSGLAGMFGRTIDAIAGIFRGLIRAIVGIWHVFAGLFTGDWAGMWNGVLQIASGVWEFIKATISYAWFQIWNIVKFVGKLVWEAVKWVWGQILATVRSVVGQVVSGAKGMWNGISAGISAAFSAVKWWLTAVWNFFSGIVGDIVRGARGMWDPIYNGLRGVLRSVVSAWNGIDFSIGPIKIPDWIPGIGGKTFEIRDAVPDIANPFARGGIINGPTLALMGEGYRKEVIFPTNDPDRGFSLLGAAGVRAPSGGGGETVIHYAPVFHVMDAKQAAEINAREYHWMQKTNGR